MESPQNLRVINARPVPELATAIDQWLAARDRFKIEPSDENLNEYDATLHDLGVALGERYPEDADMPGAFDWFRRGLIAPEDE